MGGGTSPENKWKGIGERKQQQRKKKPCLKSRIVSKEGAEMGRWMEVKMGLRPLSLQCQAEEGAVLKCLQKLQNSKMFLGGLQNIAFVVSGIHASYLGLVESTSAVPH